LPSEARCELDIAADSELYTYTINGSIIIVKELMSQKDLLDYIRKNKR
jgi:hypothetical protein